MHASCFPELWPCVSCVVFDGIYEGCVYVCVLCVLAGECAFAGDCVCGGSVCVRGDVKEGGVRAQHSRRGRVPAPTSPSPSCVT